MRISKLLIVLSGVFVAIILVSCSKSGHTPIATEISPNDIPAIPSDERSDRTVLAVYDAVIDPDAKTFTITPVERTADFHVPLRYYYPDCLQIVGYTWTSYGLRARIKLSHPLPQSNIDVFDPRVIAIVPANDGVGMFFPIFNVLANNRAVMYADGYTPLWDSLGGDIPGTNNPYRTYFKNEAYRKWSPSKPEDTQYWYIDLSGFGGPMVYKLVVDISTNFPAPSQPGIDNAPEPYDMWSTIGTGLTEAGGSASIDVVCFDWQGYEDIKMKVECPDLFDGAVQLSYSGPGGYENSYVFSGTIQNAYLASEGYHSLLVAAWDIPTQIHIYEEVKVKVNDTDIFNPVDVTPGWLNFYPTDVWVEGDYAFVTGDLYGLHIFNVADPSNPVWIKQVTLPKRIHTFSISDGYGYGGDGYDGYFYILDVSSPESTFLIKSMDITSNSVTDICVIGEYAYVATGYDGLNIIDISPPESAYIVKNISFIAALDVDVANGYAYVASSDAGIKIIDIDPPESAYIVKELNTGEAYGIDVDGEYAYVAAYTSGLVVVDINPPESAEIVKSVGGIGQSSSIKVSNGYAYVTDWASGLNIIDIEPLDSAHVIKNLDGIYGGSVFIKDNYAYFTCNRIGLYVADITQPESAYIVASRETPSYAWGVCASGDYAYVSNGRGGVQIIDISTPELANVIISVKTSGYAYDISVLNGYVYIAEGYDGLCIVDVDPPKTAHVVKSIDTEGYSMYVNARENAGSAYAYFTSNGSGFHIVNIDSPEESYLVKSVNPPIKVEGFDVSDEYAYVVEDEIGLQIIDIDPPESAQIVKTVELEGSYLEGVGYSDGYAFVSNDYDDLLFYVIDVDPVESSKIIDTRTNFAWFTDCHVSDGYLYTASEPSGMFILDISPAESFYIEAKVDTPDRAYGCFAQGDYAYIGDQSGLRIIKLR